MSTTSSSAAVEVLAIGSELLQGEIADTNTPQIARRLRSIGLAPRCARPRTENPPRQPLLPSGPLPLENPVGTAPAFIVEVGDRSIISLPGVPAEMVTLLEGHVLPHPRPRHGLGHAV